MNVFDKNRFRDDKIISASEIGQYKFCPLSWYLQRCGYKPKSKSLDYGKEKHIEVGKIMYYTKSETKKSNIFELIGYMILIIAFIFLVIEVV